MWEKALGDFHLESLRSSTSAGALPSFRSSHQAPAVPFLSRGASKHCFALARSVALSTSILTADVGVDMVAG